MRIAIIAVGSRGDVQPYIALGEGLKKAGHEVSLLTHRRFEPMVTGHGLACIPANIDPRDVVKQRDVSEIGSNYVKFVRWLEDVYQPVLRELFAESLEACRGADGIVFSPLGLAGAHVAEKLGLPIVAAYLQPVTPTRAFPSSTGAAPPAWFPAKGWYNYHSVRFTNGLFFRSSWRIINACREEILDLPPLPLSFYLDLDRSDAPIAYGYSPTVLPKPADWNEWQHVTGYWFLDEPGYQPPIDLVSFLRLEPQPVYIGFGSMSARDPKETLEIVLEALKRSGMRAVIGMGWSGIDELFPPELPDINTEQIYFVDSIPHDWLFPQMAAVVHHGGAGTTAAGLRAGVPSVIVPHLTDQPFWAARVAALGAGPEPIPRSKLTAGKLAYVLRVAASHRGMRQRAARLGAQIRAEDGVGEAVRFIERHLSG